MDARERIDMSILKHKVTALEVQLANATDALESQGLALTGVRTLAAERLEDIKTLREAAMHLAGKNRELRRGRLEILHSLGMEQAKVQDLQGALRYFTTREERA
jgi:hypothetical protein